MIYSCATEECVYDGSTLDAFSSRNETWDKVNVFVLIDGCFESVLIDTRATNSHVGVKFCCRFKLNVTRTSMSLIWL